MKSFLYAILCLCVCQALGMQSANAQGQNNPCIDPLVLSTSQLTITDVQRNSSSIMSLDPLYLPTGTLQEFKVNFTNSIPTNLVSGALLFDANNNGVFDSGEPVVTASAYNNMMSFMFFIPASFQNDATLLFALSTTSGVEDTPCGGEVGVSFRTRQVVSPGAFVSVSNDDPEGPTQNMNEGFCLDRNSSFVFGNLSETIPFPAGVSGNYFLMARIFETASGWGDYPVITGPLSPGLGQISFAEGISTTANIGNSSTSVTFDLMIDFERKYLPSEVSNPIDPTAFGFQPWPANIAPANFLRGHFDIIDSGGNSLSLWNPQLGEYQKGFWRNIGYCDIAYEVIPAESRLRNPNTEEVSATVYPNPAQNKTTIVYQQNSSAPTQLQLTDLQGRVLWSTSKPAEEIGTLVEEKIDLSSLSAGLYMLHFLSGEESSWLRLQKR